MKYVGLVLAIAAIVLFLLMRPKPDVSGEEARKLVGDGATLIDVRSAGEFSGGHIDGAANIPVDALARRVSEIPKDKPVVLYCQSGARSSRAAEMLKSQGYQSVHNLGGMGRW
jgi:phage shock protein E